MAERGDRLHEQDVASSESPPTASEDKKPSVKGTSKSKKWKWKQQQRWRKKRLVHDVKTEQDGDAHAACKDEVDTLGDAGFVMVNLQDEVEELTLEVTGEGVGSARVAAVDPKEEEKQVKRRNLSKKKKKKKEAGKDKDVAVVLIQEAEMKGEREEVVQTRQLLETVERVEVESVLIVEEEQSKKHKQQNKDGAGKGFRGGRKAGNLTPEEKKQEVIKSSNKKEMKVNNAGTAEKKGRVGHTTQHVQQVEGDEVVSLQKESGSSTKLKSKSRRNIREHGQVTYVEYLDHDVVIRELEMGSLLQGKLRVNPMYRTDGYVTVDGLSVDVLVKGMEDRNRAFDGDLVAVRLHPESAWKSLADDCGRNAANQAASKFMSSDAGVDQNALHSLWLPNVQVDQCFQTRTPEGETSVDMLKQTMAHLNERVIGSRKRPTASVVFILAQGNAHGFVGSLEAKTKVKDLSSPLSSNDNYAYFNADDPRLPRHIRIPRLQLPDEFVSRPMQYSKSMLCFCRIKAWSTKHQSPMGEFVKTVGEYTGIETGISAILFQHGLQAHTLDFDSSILDELDNKYGASGEKWKIPNEELQSRRDFRDMQIFSIDPYNARDLDDALHIRALDGLHTKFEIGVHIADVTHFIEHNSLLDLEARSRATSVYLANRVLPMLPRILCEKLCSLQPQVDRLAFSVVWQMNLDGTLVDGVEPWFGKSVIRSCCKLDYGSAQMMLDGAITEENVDKWEEDRRPIVGANPNITAATVIQSVKDLWSIGENRRAMRFETGAVSLNDLKLVFSLDAMGNPTRYGSYELKNSNRLVEEYMLLANYLVAQQLLRAHGALAFLRHHPPPASRSLDQTLERLNESDIKLDGRSTKQLAESLDRIRQDRGEVTFSVVQALIIKPMKPAEYMVAGNGASPASWRHYALNIPYYTHFTSPIRRYADVVVHRLLLESCVTGASSFNDGASKCADANSRMAEYTSVAQNSNEKKMTSKKAETECDKVFLCAFVHHHGDIEVTGVVLSTGQKGFTVYILELGLEQRLFLRDMRLVGSWNGKKSQLSIRLPMGSRLIPEKQESRVESGNEDATDTNAKQNASEMVTLTFMKQLRMRMSTTKKMPLSLIFSVIAEKTS
uniref:RNB domain-containing protein n=1 Tax=Hyaloperonospora arabidopsidis (strain Emoy2) TaxID=559515 RepID=M4B3K5_HYAAE